MDGEDDAPKTQQCSRQDAPQDGADMGKRWAENEAWIDSRYGAEIDAKMRLICSPYGAMPAMDAWGRWGMFP